MKHFPILFFILAITVLFSCKDDGALVNEQTEDTYNPEADLSKVLPINLAAAIDSGREFTLAEKRQMDKLNFDYISYQGVRYTVDEAYDNLEVRTAYFHLDYFTSVDDKTVSIFQTLRELEDAEEVSNNAESRAVACRTMKVRFWENAYYGGAMLQYGTYYYCGEDHHTTCIGAGDVFPTNWWYRVSSAKRDNNISNNGSLLYIDDNGNMIDHSANGDNFQNLALWSNWNDRVIAWTTGNCKNLDPDLGINYTLHVKIQWAADVSKVLDQNMSTNNLLIYPDHGNDNQTWFPMVVPNVLNNPNQTIYHKLHNKQSTQVVDNHLLNDNAYLHNEHDGWNQEWEVEVYDDRSLFNFLGFIEFSFVNKETGKLLTVMSDHNVEAYPRQSNSYAQRWRLAPQ